MHAWSAPASRRMFAARCLTTYYYVRGLHAESFRAFLSFSSSSHFTDAAVELGALPLPGGFAAFFAHLGEVVCAILRHVGRAALSSDGAVVFTATFFFKRCSSLFSDTSIIIFAILIADCASPLRPASVVDMGAGLTSSSSYTLNPFSPLSSRSRFLIPRSQTIQQLQ